MEEVIIRLGVDSSGFSSGVLAVEGSLSSVKTAITDIGSKLAQLFTVGAFFNLAREAVQYASSIGDAAEATRTSLEAYQALSALARDSGASVQQLEKALIQSAIAGEKAQAGNQQLTAAFNLLNINIDTFVALAPERKLELLGKAYVDAGRSQEAFVALTDILGTKVAPRLLAAMVDLADNGIDKIIERYREMGVVMDAVTAAKLDALADQFTNWKIRTLVVMAEAVEGINGFLDSIETGKTLSQVGFEDAFGGDPELRKEAMAQLAAENALTYSSTFLERLKSFTGWAVLLGPQAAALADFFKTDEDEAAIQARILEIMKGRADEQEKISASKAAETRQNIANVEQELRSKEVAEARRRIAEGEALIKLSNMSDSERLLLLEGRRSELLDELNSKETLIGTSTRTTAQITTDVVGINKELEGVKDRIAATEARAAAEQKAAAEKALAKEFELLDAQLDGARRVAAAKEALARQFASLDAQLDGARRAAAEEALAREFDSLDDALDAERQGNAERKETQQDIVALLQEQAALMNAMALVRYNQYGRSNEELAAAGGGSTLTAWASEAGRLQDQAQRQADEVARRVANTAEGGYTPQEQADNQAALNRFNDTQRDLDNVQGTINAAQGGPAESQETVELRNVQKEIKELRAKLGAI